MVSIKRNIIESRKRINKLPFTLEEFELFLEDGIYKANYENSEYWEPLLSKVEVIYNKSCREFFAGWCEAYVTWKNEGKTVKEFYEVLEKTPIDRFERIMGAGSEGAVISLDNNKVIKVFYTRELNSHSKKLYKWCSKHVSKCLPKVYKVGRNWVVMEKLKMDTEKAIKIIATTREYVDTIWLEKIAVKEPNIEPRMTPEQKEAYDWLIMIKHDLKKCGIWSSCEFGDLRECNVGERKNGDIIFFDI